MADENREYDSWLYISLEILPEYAFVSNSTADVKHIDNRQYTVLSVACAAGTLKVCDVYSAETILQSDGLRNFTVFKLYALSKSKR